MGECLACLVVRGWVGWWMPCEGGIEGDVQGGRSQDRDLSGGVWSPRAHLDHFAAL